MCLSRIVKTKAPPHQPHPSPSFMSPEELTLTLVVAYGQDRPPLHHRLEFWISSPHSCPPVPLLPLSPSTCHSQTPVQNLGCIIILGIDFMFVGGCICFVFDNRRRQSSCV